MCLPCPPGGSRASSEAWLGLCPRQRRCLNAWGGNNKTGNALPTVKYRYRKAYSFLLTDGCLSPASCSPCSAWIRHWNATGRQRGHKSRVGQAVTQAKGKRENLPVLYIIQQVTCSKQGENGERKKKKKGGGKKGLSLKSPRPKKTPTVSHLRTSRQRSTS